MIIAHHFQIQSAPIPFSSYCAPPLLSLLRPVVGRPSAFPLSFYLVNHIHLPTFPVTPDLLVSCCRRERPGSHTQRSTTIFGAYSASVGATFDSASTYKYPITCTNQHSLWPSSVVHAADQHMQGASFCICPMREVAVLTKATNNTQARNGVIPHGLYTTCPRVY